MSDRIYYTDAYCTEFDALVDRVSRLPDGRDAIVLDRTAFYPTSGGQPHDLGLLDATAVVEVMDLDGEVVHAIAADSGLLAPGRRVHGRIDRARRFDHMQQHTGQHVLSAAFDRLSEACTVGFHLGATMSTIDLDRVLAPDAMAAAETEANRIVWENRPVHVRFVTPEEAAALPLRKDPVREGTLRIVEIEGFDLSACGGTHVSHTGEIGLIAVAGWERFRGGVRVEFVCGGRALSRFRLQRDVLAGAVQRLSVLPEELPGAIERLQAEGRDLRRAMRVLQERVSGFEAARLASTAEPVGSARIAVGVQEGVDPGGLKALASAVAEHAGHAAVLFGAGPPALVAVARAPDVAVNAAEIVAALTGRFGGRGGGKPDLAQGGGLTGSHDELVTFARELLRETLAR